MSEFREVEHQLYMAQIGRREEFDRHSIEWVEELLGDVERLEGDVETMVLKSDYDAAVKGEAKAKRKWKRRKAALRRVFAAVALDPRVFAVLFAGQDDEERAAVLTVVLAVVPLAELLVVAHEEGLKAAAERERLKVFRVRDRRSVEESYPRRFDRAALVRIAAEEKVDLAPYVDEKLTKVDLARLIAAAKYPDPT